MRWGASSHHLKFDESYDFLCCSQTVTDTREQQAPRCPIPCTPSTCTDADLSSSSARCCARITVCCPSHCGANMYANDVCFTMALGELSGTCCWAAGAILTPNVQQCHTVGVDLAPPVTRCNTIELTPPVT